MALKTRPAGVWTYSPLTGNRELGTVIQSILESSGTLSGDAMPAETYTGEGASPVIVLRKSSRQRAQWGGGPRAGTGLGDWTKQKRIKCGRRGGRREIRRVGRRLTTGGLAGHSEGLGFAMRRMGVTRVLMFSKENSGHIWCLISGR